MPDYNDYYQDYDYTAPYMDQPWAPTPPPVGTPGLSYVPGQGPSESGGWDTRPPIDTATGNTAAGWSQGGDGLWYFTPPQQGDDAVVGPPEEQTFSLRSLISQRPSYGGPSMPSYNFDPVPEFRAPQPIEPPDFTFDKFNAPTLEDAQNEPGYAHARDEGIRALQQSAAGRGISRTGGTLKDLIKFGNTFAERNYGNVFDRSANTHQMNYGNARDAYTTNWGVDRDVFDRKYQGARDEYLPKLTEWDRKSAAMVGANNLGFARDWDSYVFGVDDDFRREESQRADDYRYAALGAN
jgi:hypothetical protein